MKKAITTLGMAFFMFISLNAQDLTSKKGLPILPETGDIGLSIDAVPFFEYLGNFFHGSDYTPAPTWSFPGMGEGVPMFTIGLKQFKDPKTAYRARLRIGYTADTKKNEIHDQTDTTNSVDKTVTDKWTNSHTNIGLGFGIEKRRGKGRVQGFYGAMANLMIATSGDKLTYGNSFTGKHHDPYSTVYPWQTGENGQYVADNLMSRVTQVNDGFVFGIGVNAFIGVEYFFAPKMSIGGEFAWGIVFQTTGKSKTVTEFWDNTNQTAKTQEIKNNGATFFGIDNTNTGGAINLAFYF